MASAQDDRPTPNAPPAEQYRLGLDLAGHVYFEFDPRARRIVVGTPWTVLGYGPDEVSSSFEAWMDLVHPDDRGPLADGMRRQHQGGSPIHRIEYRMRARDGSWRAVLVSTRALDRDPDGVAVRTAGTITDVTEARALRERLQHADGLASVGALAAGVAHAVNNPLASVSSGLRLLDEELERGAADPARLAARLPELRQAVGDAIAGAERVRDVVRGLQLFSAHGSARPREPVDVAAELAAAIDLTRNAIAHRARLAVEVGRGLPRVAAASGELGQAFLNLLMSACEAIPEGNAAAHEIRVRAAAAAGGVVVEVHDTGAGIPAEQLPRIFEPYHARSSAAPGLGLAVCHALVAGAGGTIEVRSAPGTGSTFTVTLPAAPRPAETAAAAAPGPRGRVLVVDDDPLVGRSLARLLQGSHDVTVVTSPTEALARLERGERWDAILCDLMMPELSGMDVEERLLASAPEVVPRIVYLTGGAFTERARRFLAEGRPFLEKPVEAAALRERVGELVRRAGEPS